MSEFTCFIKCAGNDYRKSESNKLKEEEEELSRITLHLPKAKHYKMTPLHENIQIQLPDFSCKICEFTPNNFSTDIFPWLTTTSFQITKPGRSSSIPVISIKNKNAKSDTTIIFSHSFSHDIGKLYPFFCDIATQTKCNVISYDFLPPGNEGNSIEGSLKNDLKAVVDFSLSYFGFSIENIILMSSTLGSIGTIALASESEYRNIKGIILSTPIACKIKLRYNKITEAYNCLLKASYIIARVFIIHGENNKLININQSICLHGTLRNSLKWFPRSITHSNFTKSKYREKFYKKIKMFLESINEKYSFRYDLETLNRFNETKDNSDELKKRFNINYLNDDLDAFEEEYNSTELRISM